MMLQTGLRTSKMDYICETGNNDTYLLCTIFMNKFNTTGRPKFSGSEFLKNNAFSVIASNGIIFEKLQLIGV